MATLLKSDLFVLGSGERFTGKVVGETSTDFAILTKDFHSEDSSPPVRSAVQYIKKTDVQEVFRYGAKSVTPEYHRAAELWWQSKTMYTEGVHGFLYLPQAAMLYSPFAFLPPVIEETLWRAAGISLLALGVWRLCTPLFGARSPTAFLISSALVLVSALGSAANGQTNLHMAGLFALATADLIGKRWWRVAFWLMLALACKPTAMVMILLIGAIYLRPMSWRLALALLALGAVPFLHPHPGYVMDQYRECITKMSAAAAPPDLFQDIRGLLASFHMRPGEDALRAVRLCAAGVTLGFCFLASRRFGDPARAIFLLTLGAIYLMLFNPRTEGLSYVILGVPAALWAAREVLDIRQLLDWRTLSAAFLIAFCLSMQFSTQITGGEKNYWVRPLGAALFAAFVIAEITLMRTRWPARDRSETPRPDSRV